MSRFLTSPGRETLPPQGRSALTAYVLAWAPVGALFALSLGITSFVFFHSAPAGRSVAVAVRLALYLLLSLGVAAAIYRLNRTLGRMRRAEQRYRFVVESASDGMVILDWYGNCIEANSTACEMLGYQRSELVRRNVQDLTLPEDLARLRAGFRSFKERQPVLEELRLLRQDGTVILVEANEKMIDDGVLIVSMRDITERKRAEEALRASEERYRLLFERNLAGVCRRTLDGEILDCNESFARTFGYPSRHGMVNLNAVEMFVDPDEHSALEDQLLAHGAVTNRELRIRRRDGGDAWVLGNLSLIQEEDGRRVVQCTFIDITERKKAEERLRTSLREKEVLLKEVHHRVKNNLQLISSLLSLQAACLEREQERQKFEDSQNRINSIALIHEKLYRSQDLARIDFAGYLRSLAANLFQAYRIDREMVRLRVSVEDMAPDLDTAIPCGLIVTELISNALKHAFPEGRRGEIQLSVRCEDAGWTRLSVRDTGVGLPPGFQVGETASLGLRLVQALTRQLHGRLETSAEGGSEFKITFPSKHSDRKEIIYASHTAPSCGG